MNSQRLGIKLFSLFMAAILAFSLGTPLTAQAQDPLPFTAEPLTPVSILTIDKAAPGAAQPMVSVVVQLKDAPLATYEGDIAGLPATSPAKTGEEKLNVKSKDSQAYLKYLEKKHQNFRSSAARTVPQGQITRDFSVIINAVTMLVPVDQISSLYNIPEVESVLQDELLQPATDNSPQFIGATSAWLKAGGQEKAGEGVIVGVIDTGIWPEHPSFSDPDPSGKPYQAPPPAPSGQARACQFTNPAFTCNNKLIGAYSFMNTYWALNPNDPGYHDARDQDGHGTHTASTAAGNANVEASIFGVSRGLISGIAPRAHVIAYHVCGAQGCYSSDSVAAVQQAILDGVDVINFSISGGANPYADSVELAFLNAYNAGIFVAASAGNSGPAADTTDHRGPWVTTVAASTQNRAFENTVTLTADGGASLTLTGASITGGVGPAPVVIPSDPLCNSPLPAGSVAGQIVLCRRGTTGRAEKGYNVLQGGAVGMILYNQAANVTDLETDNHYLPAIHLQFSQGQQIVSFLASNTGVQATLTAGQKVAAQGDVMASFSSRGGTGQVLGVSKPDITAPGVQILAGASPQHLTPAQGGVALGPEGEYFQAIAGTSMSSPHIAGAGALLAGLHPDWTPGQIKSALMTTAVVEVVKEDGVTPATTFDDGSGRVDVNKASDPGLTFDVTAQQYLDHAADLWNVNYPSIYVPGLAGQITLSRTARSLLNGSTTWLVDVVYGGNTDFTIVVPKSLSVPSRGSMTFNITIDARDVPINAVRSATIWLRQKGAKDARFLHIPVTFIRKQAVVTLGKVCDPATIPLNANTTCTITFQNTTFNPAPVTVTDTLPAQLKLVKSSVTGGTVLSDGKTVRFTGTLPAAQPPNVTIGTGGSPAGGYLPLSLFGIAPVAGVGDETAVNFNVPSFVYAGNTYSRIGVVSNGYVVVGGTTGANDIQFVNQNLPDATQPNNVLAPFWTDFNPGAGGAIRVGTLTDGVDTWIVVDFAAVKEYSTTRTDSFQVWIGTTTGNPAEDISFAYGTLQGNGDGGFMTVGAENLFGNRGANYYYNGSGTLPTSATQLVVTGTAGAPSAPQTITFQATGVQKGPWTNYAQMISELFPGISFASFSGQVTP